MKIGDKFTTNAGLVCKVIRVLSSKKVIVEFEKTHTTKEVYNENLYKGKVRDHYYPSTYDIGYLGDIDKTIPYYKQANQLWRNMMKRCYSRADNHGYRGSVSVDSRWLCLANFMADLPKLENFDKWLEGGSCTKTKYQLDKDILGDGTLYSLYTCKFISEHENKSLGALNARAWDARYGRETPKTKQKRF